MSGRQLLQGRKVKQSHADIAFEFFGNRTRPPDEVLEAHVGKMGGPRSERPVKGRITTRTFTQNITNRKTVKKKNCTKEQLERFADTGLLPRKLAEKYINGSEKAYHLARTAPRCDISHSLGLKSHYPGSETATAHATRPRTSAKWVQGTE